MNDEFYKKLVDLYAGHELSEEVETEMEWVAMGNATLNHDMTTLRRTVDLLHEDQIEFTEESFQRILNKVYMRTGVDARTASSPDPLHLQYSLPIQG